MSDLVQEYEADRKALSTHYELSFTRAYLDRTARFNAEWLSRLEKMDFERLDPEGRIDHVLLVAKLRKASGETARQRSRLEEMARLVPAWEWLVDLDRGAWRGQPPDLRVTSSRLEEWARKVKELKDAVEKGSKDKGSQPPSSKTTGTVKSDEIAPITVQPVLARRVADTLDQIRHAIERWYGFYDGYRPDFSWWMKKPRDGCIKALDDYAKLLREEIAGLKGKDEDPLIGEPCGEKELESQIRSQFLPYSARELIAIGERELSWGEQELKASAKAMGCGDDWHAALEKVKEEFVPPGQQDELIAGIAREATEFVKRHRIVSVPPLCEETWKVSLLSTESMKTIPYAAYGGQSLLVAYAKEDMAQDDKLMMMRGNNRCFVHLTTPHELIPGHHLQAFVSARSRPYRHVFSTPFSVEGWALYGELRLWALGWPRNPCERIGMLFWRMNRAARIVVSLRFHLGMMKPQEMVEFLIKRVGHEKLGATNEVRRFLGEGYEPLYQASYLLGGLQLAALREEVVSTGKMVEQDFNDRVLQEGPIPIELIRSSLLGLSLTRDAAPVWRFMSTGSTPASIGPPRDPAH